MPEAMVVVQLRAVHLSARVVRRQLVAMVEGQAVVLFRLEELLHPLAQANPRRVAAAHAVLAKPDLQDLLAKMATTVMMENRERMEPTARMPQPANNHLLLTSASTAHLDLQGLQATPDPRDHQDSPEAQATMAPQDKDRDRAHQDLPDLQDNPDNQDSPAQLDNPEPSTTFPDNQDHQDQLALQGLQDPVAIQEARAAANPARQVPLETPAHPDPQEMQAPPVSQEAMERPAREVDATIVLRPVQLPAIKPPPLVEPTTSEHKPIDHAINTVSSSSCSIVFHILILFLSQCRSSGPTTAVSEK